MIKLKNTNDAKIKLANEDLSPELLKDILFQLFIMETQFQEDNLNEIIILNKDEPKYQVDLIPEIEEEIEGYKKTLYIICDSGEGLIIYHELGGNNE